MKYEEFIKLVKGMKSIWTKPDFLPDREAVDMWYALLKDLPYEEVSVAIQKYAMTHKWSPAVSDIREQVVGLNDRSTDWGEAWGNVLKAVGRYGYMNEEEALNSMDTLTSRIVRRLGWQTICKSDINEQTAIRANFRMMYEESQNKERENARLPAEFRDSLPANQKQLEEKLGGIFNAG